MAIKLNKIVVLSIIVVAFIVVDISIMAYWYLTGRIVLIILLKKVAVYTYMLALVVIVLRDELRG